MRRLLLAPVLSAFVLSLVAGPLPAAADPDYRQVVDITFPTDPRARYIDDYDQPRGGGRMHRATDLVGEKMWEVYAAVGGTITFIPGAAGEPEPSYGYMIRIEGDDGRTYNYIHLNNDTPGTDDNAGGPRYAYAPGLQRGSRVERGQHIGWLGDSGNAEHTVPHLHFEIVDPAVRDPYGSNRINPYFSLRAAEARGDYATPGQGPGTSAPVIDRVSGRNRVETAIALSQAAFTSARTVVLTSGASFPDAIIAGPLAAALGAPVLTTFGTELEAHVAAEIRRLGAEEAYIIGPRSRVSADLERQVVNSTDVTPSDLHRLTGATDAETAAVVAARVRSLTGATGALVALGSHPEPGRAWPDALTAGYHGALSGQPVLLVDHDSVPQATVDALRDVDVATIVGGTAAVSEASAAAVGRAAGAVRRLSGRDRFATAGAVGDDLLERRLADPSRLWAATGHNYADALAAAGALAATGELLVLVDGSDRGGDNALTPWYGRHAPSISAGRAIGGSDAVSEAALERLAERIR